MLFDNLPLDTRKNIRIYLTKIHALPKADPMASPTLLIIDDNPALHEIMAEYLGACGYETVSAGNGREGVELYRALQPDLVLLDLRMPVMNGYEASRGIKQIDPQARIILVTGYPEDQLAQLSKAHGFVASVIGKPCSLQSLAATVDQVLAA